jgi:transposase
MLTKDDVVIKPRRNIQAAKFIHMDNCSIHTNRATEDYMKQNNMMRPRHPPYSPDLAPSGFYLFPSVKEKLKNIRMVGEAIYSIDSRNF